VRVLIVDDDPVVSNAMIKALSRGGSETEIAPNGLAALTLASQHPYDVIICDLRMPFLDGEQFFSELKKLYPDRSRRVLFVSAWVQEPELAAFLNRTGRPVLRKPFEISELLRAVEQVAARPLGADVGRRLPEAFLERDGSALARTAALLDHHFPFSPLPARQDLIQELVPLLSPLLEPGAAVTEEIRRECERTVTRWLEGQ